MERGRKVFKEKRKKEYQWILFNPSLFLGKSNGGDDFLEGMVLEKNEIQDRVKFETN